MLTTLTRTVIKSSLLGLRLPLTIVERVTHNTGGDWAPAMAFDKFEASAKQVLGSLIGDEHLATEGKLQQARADQLARGAELEIEAERVRAGAAQELDERHQKVAEAREQAKRQAEQAEQKAQDEKAAAEQRARQEARKREAAAKRAEARRQEQVSAQERAADKVRIEAESAALAERRRALAATKKAQMLGDAVDAKKAERRA